MRRSLPHWRAPTGGATRRDRPGALQRLPVLYRGLSQRGHNSPGRPISPRIPLQAAGRNTRRFPQPGGAGCDHLPLSCQEYRGYLPGAARPGDLRRCGAGFPRTRNCAAPDRYALHGAGPPPRAAGRRASERAVRRARRFCSSRQTPTQTNPLTQRE